MGNMPSKWLSNESWEIFICVSPHAKNWGAKMLGAEWDSAHEVSKSTLNEFTLTRKAAY